MFAGFCQFLDAIFNLIFFSFLNEMATFTYLNNKFWYFTKIYIHCNTNICMLALILFLTDEAGSQIEFPKYLIKNLKLLFVGFFLT